MIDDQFRHIHKVTTVTSLSQPGKFLSSISITLRKKHMYRAKFQLLKMGTKLSKLCISEQTRLHLNNESTFLGADMATFLGLPKEKRHSICVWNTDLSKRFYFINFAHLMLVSYLLAACTLPILSSVKGSS